jgi:Domain of unknown function (DUF1937)
MSYIYLASPYSHPDHTLRARRWTAAVDACAWMADVKEMAVYSPIVHWHKVAVRHHLPGHNDYWTKQNEAFIIPSSAIWILTIDGWRRSKGVASEISFAMSLSKPILYLQPLEKKRGEYIVREQPE